MDLAERDRLLQNWRGRRLLACRAAGELDEVIKMLGEEDGSQLPPENPIGAPTDSVKAELQNTCANLLRLILLMNDGSVSRHRLNSF